MRITNSMVSNNILLSLNKNKEALSILEGQLATGKKIQKPSDDPIVAVRALKFRTNVREVKQFKTNASDAQSWMSVTEQSMQNSINILKRARELSVQGSSDTLGVNERESIALELDQLKNQLVNEGNVNYAGRYIFTGYKTDVPLVYTEPVTDQYEITEHFTTDDVQAVTKVIDGTPPQKQDVYRIRLAYPDITESTPPATIAGLTVNATDTSDTNAYTPTVGNVNFIQDTGELIFNSGDVPTLPANIDFTYHKSGFEKNDLNPKHYFDAVHKVDPSDSNTWVAYAKKDDAIEYQISYNQKIDINSLGKNIITTDVIRDLEEIVKAVKNVPNDGSQNQKLLEDQLGDLFSGMIGKLDRHVNHLLGEQANLGTRMNRLELTMNRLDDDEINFTTLLSENEDIDIAEVVVKMQSQEMVYNAALMSSSKIIQPSLLDFIR